MDTLDVRESKPCHLCYVIYTAIVRVNLIVDKYDGEVLKKSDNQWRACGKCYKEKR